MNKTTDIIWLHSACSSHYSSLMSVSSWLSSMLLLAIAVEPVLIIELARLLPGYYSFELWYQSKALHAPCFLYPYYWKPPTMGCLIDTVNSAKSHCPTEDKKSTTVCSAVMTEQDAHKMKAAIRQRYWLELHVENLPVFALVGSMEPSGGSGGGP